MSDVDVEEEELAREEHEAALRLARRVEFLAKLRKKKIAIERANVISEVYGEQPFKAGVDQGLKIWIKVREQMRSIESGVEIPMTYPTRIKYDSRWYWMSETHREWRDMIDECIEQKEQAEQFIEDTEYFTDCILNEIVAEAVAQEVFYATESDEDRQTRQSQEHIDSQIKAEESAMMAAADEESSIIEFTLREWAAEELASRPQTSDPEKPPPEFDEDGTRIRYNEDGTRKEDRGVYGMLPLLNPKEPKRTPGLTVAEFMNHWQHASNKAETLLLAFSHFHWKYMDMLMESAGPSAQEMLNMPVTKNKRTLLHLSVLGGDQERVSWLLDHGARPTVQDDKGDTPLHCSIDHDVFAQYHPTSIAANLLRSRHRDKAKGANRSFKLVNTANHRGVTVLHRAILFGALEFVKLFLKNKAQVYVFDNNHMLPIQYAKEDYKQEIKDLFNENVRFCGKRMHQEMWAYLMSQEFVKSIFTIVAPVCSICKRKQYDCASLKKSNFRYWIYTHELAKKHMKKN